MSLNNVTIYEKDNKVLRLYCMLYKLTNIEAISIILKEYNKLDIKEVTLKKINEKITSTKIFADDQKVLSNYAKLYHMSIHETIRLILREVQLKERVYEIIDMDKLEKYKIEE